MKYWDNMGFEGIVLLDENEDPFYKAEWSTRGSGRWTPVQEIPDGKQIVGLKINNKFLRLGFTYWEMPPFVPTDPS